MTSILYKVKPKAVARKNQGNQTGLTIEAVSGFITGNQSKQCKLFLNKIVLLSPQSGRSGLKVINSFTVLCIWLDSYLTTELWALIVQLFSFPSSVTTVASLGQDEMIHHVRDRKFMLGKTNLNILNCSFSVEYQNLHIWN